MKVWKKCVKHEKKTAYHDTATKRVNRESRHEKQIGY